MGAGRKIKTQDEGHAERGSAEAKDHLHRYAVREGVGGRGVGEALLPLVD